MSEEQKIIGWREWVRLPDLNISCVKAKIDTGARTSSLHAFDIETFEKHGVDWVRFKVHPEQKNNDFYVISEAQLHEYRDIKSSSGHQTRRPVIVTNVEILGEFWPIELTLANRDEMGFRMLLGREGIRGRMLVDPGKSYYSEKLRVGLERGTSKKE